MRPTLIYPVTEELLSNIQKCSFKPRRIDFQMEICHRKWIKWMKFAALCLNCVSSCANSVYQCYSCYALICTVSFLTLSFHIFLISGVLVLRIQICRRKTNVLRCELWNFADIGATLRETKQTNETDVKKMRQTLIGTRDKKTGKK